MGKVKAKLMVQDVKKAYFYAPATRDVYVELPDERAQPGMCAKLLRSQYGTRDAALNWANWARAYSEVLESIGFVKGLSSPCSFHHPAWAVRTVVHGDGFVPEGRKESLKKMDAAMKKVLFTENRNPRWGCWRRPTGQSPEPTD